MQWNKEERARAWTNKKFLGNVKPIFRVSDFWMRRLATDFPRNFATFSSARHLVTPRAIHTSQANSCTFNAPVHSTSHTMSSASPFVSAVGAGVSAAVGTLGAGIPGFRPPTLGVLIRGSPSPSSASGAAPTTPVACVRGAPTHVRASALLRAPSKPYRPAGGAKDWRPEDAEGDEVIVVPRCLMDQYS